MSESATYPYTKDQCLQWIRNPIKDPITNQSIIEDRQSFKLLLKTCRHWLTPEEIAQYNQEMLSFIFPNETSDKEDAKVNPEKEDTHDEETKDEEPESPQKSDKEEIPKEKEEILKEKEDIEEPKEKEDIEKQEEQAEKTRKIQMKKQKHLKNQMMKT